MNMQIHKDTHTLMHTIDYVKQFIVAVASRLSFGMNEERVREAEKFREGISEFKAEVTEGITNNGRAVGNW